MSYRPAAAAALLLSAVGLCTAQTPETYSRALPPARAVLDRLNLKTEWALNLPVQGTRDTIALVQTIDDQLFVQTRLGLLIAIDVRTGQVQWAANLGNGSAANVYPVGANSQFVYAVWVTKLYAFYRYTGITEFSAELSKPQIRGFGGAPIQGPVADESGVYLVLGASPGSAGTERVAAYNLPQPISVVTEAARLTAQKSAFGGEFKLANPVDELTRRYPVDGTVRTGSVESFDPSRAGVGTGSAGGMTSTRSPSLAALPRITPPYTLRDQPTSPSLQVVPSLRQPYHVRNAALQDIQRTPSLSTIPPSVAAALALTDLRARGIEPTMRWEYALTARI